MSDTIVAEVSYHNVLHQIFMPCNEEQYGQSSNSLFYQSVYITYYIDTIFLHTSQRQRQRELPSIPEWVPTVVAMQRSDVAFTRICCSLPKKVAFTRICCSVPK